MTAAELVQAACPTGTNDLPPPKNKWFYSNTNYILTGMTAAKAAGRSYRDPVHKMVLDPFDLDSTFYENRASTASAMERLAHGDCNNPDCAGYQPNCKVSWNAPLIGRDVHDTSLSRAQAAGGAIASARDVNRWTRVVFEGRVVRPKQPAKWMALVSQAAGDSIMDVSAGDSLGYSLGLAKGILGPLGVSWCYKGMSLGYRTLYAWLEKENLMITLWTNSQPSQDAGDADQLHLLVQRIHPIVESQAK